MRCAGTESVQTSGTLLLRYRRSQPPAALATPPGDQLSPRFRFHPAPKAVLAQSLPVPGMVRRFHGVAPQISLPTKDFSLERTPNICGIPRSFKLHHNTPSAFSTDLSPNAIATRTTPTPTRLLTQPFTRAPSSLRSLARYNKKTATMGSKRPLAA